MKQFAVALVLRSTTEDKVSLSIVRAQSQEEAIGYAVRNDVRGGFALCNSACLEVPRSSQNEHPKSLIP